MIKKIMMTKKTKLIIFAIVLLFGFHWLDEVVGHWIAHEQRSFRQGDWVIGQLGANRAVHLVHNPLRIKSVALRRGAVCQIWLFLAATALIGGAGGWFWGRWQFGKQQASSTNQRRGY